MGGDRDRINKLSLYTAIHLDAAKARQNKSKSISVSGPIDNEAVMLISNEIIKKTLQIVCFSKTVFKSSLHGLLLSKV